MSYSIFWRTPSLPFVGKQSAIVVPTGTVISNAASLRLTGKGATNYGKIQQENMLRLLENFAGPTVPDYPTVGQTWFNTALNVLQVCSATSPSPVVWQQLNSTQITGVGVPPPLNPQLGNTWFSRTGSASGVLYAYTGIGRYPQVNWDARTSGYWPAASTTLTAITNASAFGPPNTNFSHAYLNGFTSSVPADVNGTVLINGTPVAAPKGVLATNYPVTDGLIVLDQSGTMVSTSSVAYFLVIQTLDNRWFYDNDSVLIEFTPTASMYAIGTCTVAEQADGTAPGITAIGIWSTGLSLTNMKQVPAMVTNGAVGGWEQIWPAVETLGGRDEFDYLYGMLASLIGDSLIYGGSAAEGKSIQFLTPFKSLDASMELAWQALTPPDTTVLAASAVNHLRVEPNSNDWDTLLAACRYAVNRVELQPNAYLNLSPYPFVQDGLTFPVSLSTLSPTDIRYPPADRLTRRRTGTMTMMTAFQETVNVLRAAIQNRYLIKGLLEGSGSGNAYNSTVAISSQATFNAPAASFSGTVTTGLNFSFNYSHPEMQEFFYAGGALQLLLTHTPTSNTPADITLRTITNGFGRIRITADNTYVMTPAPTAVLALAPTGQGFKSFTTASVTLATLTSGSSTITIRGALVNGTTPNNGSTIAIFADITSGGTTSGTFNVQWSYISDLEQYGTPTSVNVYPVPISYGAGQKQGSGLFV